LIHSFPARRARSHERLDVPRAYLNRGFWLACHLGAVLSFLPFFPLAELKMLLAVDLRLRNPGSPGARLSVLSTLSVPGHD